MLTWFLILKSFCSRAVTQGLRALAILIQIRLNPAVEHKIDQASGYFEIHLAHPNSYFEIYIC